MNVNETPSANRLHIGIFGKRNAGKSSFINAVTGQSIAIVSETPGTTTDPVGKAMEIAGPGPVMIYDTAGLDDTGDLGELRVGKTLEVLRKINLAVYLSTYSTLDKEELDSVIELKGRVEGLILVLNKTDEAPVSPEKEKMIESSGLVHVNLSCKTGENLDTARKLIAESAEKLSAEASTIIGDIVHHGDFVYLVVPVDLGAPKGRLILPQVQMIRDILDNDAVSIVVKEREFLHALKEGPKPALVICDSQVVLKVAGDVPPDVKMTTFSILFSRLKGDLSEFVKGAAGIEKLRDGDKVLMMEACTHHAQADDIGRVKIPRWIKQYTGKDVIFETNSGPYVSKTLKDYKLIIACGGCMINRREMLARIGDAASLNIPITNYGVAISYVQGVLKKALSPFPYELGLLDEL